MPPGDPDPTSISTGGQVSGSGDPDPLGISTGGALSGAGAGAFSEELLPLEEAARLLGEELPIDAKLLWSAADFIGDVRMGDAGDLQTGDLLASAVIASLLTWRLADPNDDTSDYGGDRQGWWGDSYAAEANDLIGSRLWLLFRSKLNANTLVQIRQFCEESLAWLIEDQVASRVDVQVERFELNSVAVLLTVYRRDGTFRVLRFDGIWEAIHA